MTTIVSENSDINSVDASTETPVALETISEEAAATPAPIDSQAQADKAAIDASGSFHLTSLYQEKVNNSHAKVANLVAKVMSSAERALNWTREEVIVLWNKIESELNTL